MKRIATILCAGFAAMTAQLLLVRELMVIALGDELTVGLVFFAWMLWVGVGSAAGGLLFRRWTPPDALVGALTILLGLLVPVSVIWARMQAPLFGFTQGEIVPVDTVLLMALAALLPVCLAAGLAFPMLCAKAAKGGTSSASAAETADTAGRVYAWDTLGAVLGGLAFSLLLIPLLGTLTCALAVFVATGLVGALWFGRAGRVVVWAAVLAAAATSSFWLGGAAMRSRTAYWGESFHRGYESPYGTVTVLKDEGQYSLFTSGRFSAAVPDRVFGEFTAHVPMLAHPEPKKIFVAGGSGAMLAEMLKHKPARIVAAELDPLILKLKEEYTDNAGKAAFADSRVELVASDPFIQLKQNTEKYDVMIIDAGAPENIQVNRYYTSEFFALLHSRLAPGGIAAITVPFKENYTGRDDAALLGTILKTMESAGGGRPLPVPGAKTFFLWQPGADLTVDPADAAARFTARGITSAHFNADSAAYYFDPTRIGFALSQFSDDVLEYSIAQDKIAAAFGWLMNRPGTLVNTDSSPICVFYSLQIKTSYYKSHIGRLIKLLADRLKLSELLLSDSSRVGMMIFFVVLLAVLSGMVGVKGVTRKPAIAFAMAIIGFFGIAYELLLIISFQSKFGVVYQYIGLITALFLAGSAAGSAAHVLIARKSRSMASIGIPLVLCIAIAVPFYCISILYAPDSSELFSFLLLSLSFFTTGLSVGYAFPAAITGYSQYSGSGSSAGVLYSADLLGACAGAFLVSTTLIPLIGIGRLCVVLTFLACASFMPVLVSTGKAWKK